jgi:hypothetical protein
VSNRVKIGVSVSPLKRLRVLRASSPVQLYLHAFIKMPSYQAARSLEKKLHRDFHSYLVHNEWFNFDNMMEIYVCDIIGFNRGLDLPDILGQSILNPE